MFEKHKVDASFDTVFKNVCDTKVKSFGDHGQNEIGKLMILSLLGV